MSQVRDNGEFRLTILPEPRAVSTARLFVAACARHLEFAENEVEDIRLGVSEAVTRIVTVQGSTGNQTAVELCVDFDDTSVTVSVVGGASDTSPPDAEDVGTMGLAVIHSLFQSAQTGWNDNGAATVSFLLERPALHASAGGV